MRPLFAGRATLALVLASTAVAAAIGYAEALHGSERHTFSGASGNHAVNATLMWIDVGAGQVSSGDIVRIEQDTSPRFPYGLDLYVVPEGQAGLVLSGQATVLLHVSPQVPRVRPAGGVLDSNASHSASAWPNDSDVVHRIEEQVQVPEGFEGVELVWVNRTTAPGGTPEISVVVTRVTGPWLGFQTAFLAVESCLVASAFLALLFPRRRRPNLEPPANVPGHDPASEHVSNVAALVLAAGRTLEQLRNAMAAAGVFLLAALLLGKQFLWRLLDDRVGVWAPAAESAVQAAYAVAAAAALAGWAVLAYRTHRRIMDWRRHMGANPLA